MKSIPALLGLTLLSITFHAHGMERLFTFDNDRVASPPDGFLIEGDTGGTSTFAVMKDESAKSPPNFLIMQGTAYGGSKYLIALAWFSNIQDGEISVWLKHAGQPKTARTGGLTWRYQSSNEFYSLEWDTTKSLLSLILTENGRRKILDKTNLPIAPEQWAQMKVRFEKASIRCSINDKTIFETEDSTIQKAGKVGLLINSNVMVAFDDFDVKGND